MENQVINEAWYEEYLGNVADDLSSNDSQRLKEALKKIVAEAERRGRIRGWSEAMDYASRTLETEADIQDDKSIAYAEEKLYKKMSAKINELKGV